MRQIIWVLTITKKNNKHKKRNLRVFHFCLLLLTGLHHKVSQGWVLRMWHNAACRANKRTNKRQNVRGNIIRSVILYLDSGCNCGESELYCEYQIISLPFRFVPLGLLCHFRTLPQTLSCHGCISELFNVTDEVFLLAAGQAQDVRNPSKPSEGIDGHRGP